MLDNVQGVYLSILSSNMSTTRTKRLQGTPSVSKQKLSLDIICVTKQMVRLVKFLSNFVKRTGMLPKTM
jgi:hypothetical protein